MKELTMGTLFSGVGAIEEAARRNGIETLWNCEIEAAKRLILKKHFPHATQYADIRDVNYPERVDIIAGGWPCQGNSRAKQWGAGQLGLDDERSGLFTEFARILRQVRPECGLFENVPDVLTINGGRDFNRILSTLAGMGYDASWGVLRASDIGAPHHRARLYMVAHPRGFRLPTLVSIWKNVRAQVVKERRIVAGAVVEVGGPWREAQPSVLRVDDESTAKLDEPRIHGCGNAVVVGIPEAILKQIKLHWPTTP